MSARAKPRWRSLIQLKVVVPVAVTAALLAFLLSISDLPQVFGRIQRMSFEDIALTFVFAFGYLVIKGFVQRYLLSALELGIAWRKLVLAYAIGEMTLTLPAGVYLENYVLERLGSAGFARSAAAVTAMLALEGPIALTVVLIFGIPEWVWLRPAIVAVFGFFAVLIGVAVHLGRSEDLRRRFRRLFDRPRLRKLGEGLRDLLRGLRALASARVAAVGTALTVAYLAALAAGYLVTAHGVGVMRITFGQAAVIYAFSLSVMLLFGGLLSQLGVVEAAGLAASRALGYSTDEALAMLLGFRAVWIASVWILCGTTAMVLGRRIAASATDDGEESGHGGLGRGQDG